MAMDTGKETIRVLLVDDDPADRRLVQLALDRSSTEVDFDVVTVGALSEAAEFLTNERCDIALLDLGLPDSHGLETVQKVHGINPDVPIVVLTGAADGEMALDAIRSGAEDYLVKGKPLEFALVRIIRYTVERKRTEQNVSKLLKEVENINRELSDFASIVSHDLKAPLRGIKTLAEWIMTDNADRLTEDGREQMELLSSRVDRMHNLIEGVLEYSRVGREKEKRVTVHLGELVPEIWDMISAPETISFTVEMELPEIQCEHTRISQVFQNLLSNAAKYMDKPEGHVVVRCVETGHVWEFSVSDNGPGIDQRHFEKIFRMFQTLTARDGFESTGVGLTVVKKIVEMYGGKIWVESEVGKGTTFFFTLPKTEVEVTNAELKANTSC
jgi:signal transduction histidine kinase